MKGGISLVTMLEDFLMWHEKIEVKKGDLGEKIVDAYLNSKNMVVYSTNYNGAHPFDRLLSLPDKSQLFIADIKTKPGRLYYPDTGINIKHFKEYIHIQNLHNIKVFLFFVDQVKEKIYGNFLHELVKPYEIEHNDKIIKYPLESSGIIYFPLFNMRNICDLTQDYVNDLKRLSSGRYSYDKDE